MRISLRSAALASALLMAAAFAGPASADQRHDITGVWVSTDTDGSAQRLVIGAGPNGLYRVLYTDEGASACGPGPRGDLVAAALRGNMTRAGDELSGDLPLVCRTSPPQLLGVFRLTFTYEAASDTLVDTFGIVWSRR